MGVSSQKQLFTYLGETPGRIRSIIKGLSAAQAKSKPNRDEFSILEHICHLRDIETQGNLVRVQRLKDGGNPFLEDLDGDRLAAEGNYRERDADIELAQFENARNRTLSLAASSTARERKNLGELEGVGNINISVLLLIVAKHDEEHVIQITKIMRVLRVM